MTNEISTQYSPHTIYTESSQINIGTENRDAATITDFKQRVCNSGLLHTGIAMLKSIKLSFLVVTDVVFIKFSVLEHQRQLPCQERPSLQLHLRQ